MNAQNILKISVLAAAMGMVVSSGPLMADEPDTNEANQTVGYQVNEIALISVSGDPGDLVITTTVDNAAGAVPLDVTDATTTWAITSNKGTDAKKVTAVLGGDMPPHTELKVQMGLPTGAAAPDPANVSLNTRATGAALTAQDVVTGIDPVAESGKTITYTFSADVEAGVVVNADATVTFTLTDV